MKTKEEIKKWILENCVNEYGDISLTWLDFSDFDGDIYISHMKVKKGLYQEKQKVEGNLHQARQNVKGSLYQSHQMVKGDLWQSFQFVKGKLDQDCFYGCDCGCKEEGEKYEYK